MKTPKKNLAAIDIGTNSFHLIVVEIDTSTGRFKILDREKEIVRLGSGSTDMKYLSEAAMERGVETLKRFKDIADSLGAPVRAIATSAVREALNKDEFIRLVQTETGVRMETASGVEEARLIYLGILQALPIYARKILMVDIGGGSTEFLVGQRGKIQYSNSLKVGAVRLTQRFFKDAELDSRSIHECRRYVAGMLAPVVRSVGKYRPEVVVGSSGTITNIARMVAFERGEEETESVNNFTFTQHEMTDVVKNILDARDATGRSGLGGLDPGRADIIPAGAIILEQILKELNIKSMTVSEYALREGIVLDTIQQEKTYRKADHLGDIRYGSVVHLATLFHNEQRHAAQVAKLALRIFDQTARLHRLGEKERGYLESAAMLHEIGLFVSHDQHHRHSYYLIRNAELLGFTENEKEIIANVARYHRKSHPKMKHEGYRKLDADDQRVVTVLASILRIADGLDRSHSSRVSDIRCRKVDGTLRMHLKKRGGAALDLEMWGADRKKSLFEDTFGLKVKLS